MRQKLIHNGLTSLIDSYRVLSVPEVAVYVKGLNHVTKFRLSENRTIRKAVLKYNKELYLPPEQLSWNERFQ